MCLGVIVLKPKMKRQILCQSLHTLILTCGFLAEKQSFMSLTLIPTCGSLPEREVVCQSLTFDTYLWVLL